MAITSTPQTNPSSRRLARPPFVDELEQLARLASLRPELQLQVDAPGSGWRFDWDTATIGIDGGRLNTETEDFTRGLVLHESAHAAITRLHDMVPLKLFRDRRVFALLNLLEDCRIETWMQQRFPGCRPWVREYNDRLFSRYLTVTEDQPPAVEFLNGILVRWWFGEIQPTISVAAASAMREVWPAVKSLLQALPGELTTRDEFAADYAASPVRHAYAEMDDQMPPCARERGVRLAQYEMWTIVHREILPRFFGLIPAQAGADLILKNYIDSLMSLIPERHLTRLSQVPNGPHSRMRRPRGGEPPKSIQFGPGNLSAYIHAREGQHSTIELLANGLLRWFQVHGKTRILERLPSGSRISLQAAMRFEADPRRHDELWSRPILPRKIDPHFTLVIDRSSSMRGERMAESLQGTVVLCEVCHRVGVPLTVYAFSNTVETLLQHDTPLDTDVCSKLGALVSSTAGRTDLTEALKLVFSNLQDSPFEDRYVFVISDGKPDDAPSACAEVNRLLGDGIVVIGLGLGPDTKSLDDIIPMSHTNLSAKNLPKVLAMVFMSVFGEK